MKQLSSIALAMTISLGGVFAVQAQNIHYADKIIALNSDTSPGDDFYRYVNQHWLQTNTIPQGYPLNGAFVKVNQETTQQLKQIIQEIKQKDVSKLSIDEQNTLNLYLSFMDTNTIEERGINAIAPQLKQIDEVSNLSQMTYLMSLPEFTSVVGQQIGIDFDNPNQYLIQLYQNGLGMGDSVFYLAPSRKMATIRTDYQHYMTQIFELLGFENARKRAQEVFDFETAIAKVHWSVEQTQDLKKLNHKMTLVELSRYAPDIDWKVLFHQTPPERSLFSHIGAWFTHDDSYTINPNHLDNIMVSMDSAIRDTARVYANTPLETLKNYQRFHVVSNFSTYLPKELADLTFRFYSESMQGVSVQRPREERTIELLNSAFGDTFGRLYVNRFFSAEDKTQMQELVDYLLKGYGERFKKNAWMDDETRQQALQKLANIKVNIGYPDKWHDTQSIHFSSHDLVGNIVQIQNWELNDALSKLDEPVREWEWTISPQVVNARYEPTTNDITFPAAILQPPFFNPKADPAYNFGTIGAVIGHEIGHGFDARGNMFDGSGKMRNWWSSQAGKQFRKRTSELIKQYEQYSANGVPVNGRLTLNENIGDLGGVGIALHAYQEFERTHYPDGKAPIIDGTTGEQRFFIGWANLWKQMMAPEFAHNIALTDPHSPGEFRVNGIVRNIDEWYEAFDVKPDDALYLPKEKRVKIW
ncbi:M13 family metallopeptidase [Vibrio parahaemolyticus]|uniref:M13 family metallopeptidase n=1 Tax=Vibrio parahaemolyticus TaxID=670 RepID=UPI00235F3219|nr:M13 family metallopeptidase [Vibrio parahaemolyticus]